MKKYNWKNNLMNKESKFLKDGIIMLKFFLKNCLQGQLLLMQEK
jgi:hypothetical protein